MTLQDSILPGRPAPGSLGIFGGTFNPIHTAHLIIAEEARIRLGLEEVQFIPNRIPPHKREEMGLASEEDRYLMAALATADNPSFFVSRIELDREGPSYTYDTLKALRDRIPRLFVTNGIVSLT
ncbi:MAG: nicotinate-nicotinamide nucleotide adenylyltransferase [Armatimonadetes bacterium]|nr:nicotinate-nicotinamide nucleotide adenylyltransferase [Armatimonadota bacterium]